MSNFFSQSAEHEIMVDLEFWADFNSSFFENHFEFNRFTDKHISASGFISHHHLVRYILNIRDLEEIEVKLLKGFVDGTTILVDPLLKNFIPSSDTANTITSCI